VPTVGVTALPLEKDLFTWHCNMRGPKGTPYEGGVFHLVLEFPQSYPCDPPQVNVSTSLPHPNVFSGKICLNMLQPGDEQEKYLGWSSAYSVQSILIQLQAFLFEVSPSTQQFEIQKAVEAANNYTCPTCKHRPLRSWPPFPAYEKDAFILNKSEVELLKEELICFHSKRSFSEDVLGFGISYHKNIKTGDIQEISSPLDLIGLRAYMREKIRKSAVNEPFTHWLPVYLNDEHGKKAFHLAKRSMSMICTGNTKDFKPQMALVVLPKLMNTMILEIMKGQIHASVRALEGYCAFHQLFVKFLEEYPELLEECRKIVTGFLESEENRHKDKVSSLGEFMCYLTVCPEIEWKDIAPLIVNEQADRQVMWILKDYPHLETDQEIPNTDKVRASVSFDSSIMGIRHILFHYYFIQHVARPLGANISKIAEKYAQAFGRPTNRMVENMLQAFREIKKVKTHNDYYSRIGLPVVSDEELAATLRKSIANSKAKGYHGVEGPKVPSAQELAEESIKSVVPLETLCIKNEKGEPKLHDDQEKWKGLCNSRWGFNSLPTDYPASWKIFYLQNNLQDLVSSLNDYPDFKHFYRTLDISAEALTMLELTLFTPKQLKSGFFWITALLSRSPNLKSLKITRGPGCGLGIKGVRCLVKGLKNNKSSLTSLDLSHAGVGQECCKLLAEGILASTNLEKLSLEGNSIEQRGAKELSKVLWEHERLTHVNLSNCRLDANAAKDLADGLLANKHLTHLNLSRNSLAHSGLRAVIYNLAFSPSIQHLELSRITGSGGSPNELSELTEALSKLFRINSTLRYLNFWKTPVSSAFKSSVFEALGTNRALRHLDISEIGTVSNVQLGDLGVALTKNKVLASLLLEKNSISGSGLETFYKSLFLAKEEKEKDGEDENARKEKRRNEMLDKVKEVEKEFHLNLVEFNLSNNSLGSVAGKVLGKLVTVSTSLEVLKLESCQLSSEAGETLGLALETNTRLRTLNLRFNSIGKEGAKAIAAGIKHNNTLQVLDLSGNSVGVSGARAIAQTLADNTSITELNLFGNLVDVDGAKELAKALSTNKTLVKLDLGLNRIRNKGAQAIAQAIPSCQLHELGLKLNFIKDNGALQVAKAVSTSPTIRSFKMAGNQIEDVTLLSISELLKNAQNSFDLAPRVALLDPERVARSVWVTPLNSHVKKENVRKLFYDAHCGVVLNVTIQDHKVKVNPAKARYAFVEFAHINSVSLALDLSARGKAKVDGQKVRIYRVGTQTKNVQSESTTKPAPIPREVSSRGRGGRRGRGRR